MSFYAEYIRGFADSCIGGRVPRRGIVGRVLDAFRPVQPEKAAARALGLQDGVHDRELRTRVEVENELQRLLG